MTRTVTISVNGQSYTNEVEPRLLLVHYLRDVLTPDRHARGLRNQPLWSMYCCPQRTSSEVLYGAGSASRWR